MGYSVTIEFHIFLLVRILSYYMDHVKLGIISFPNPYTVPAAVVLSRRRQGDHSNGRLSVTVTSPSTTTIPLSTVVASYAYGLSFLATEGFTMSGESSCGYLDPDTKIS